MTEGQTGIDLHTWFFPLMWLLFFFSPAIEVDGEVTKLKWGRAFIPTAPGSHEVEVYYNYIFGPASRATMTVDVPAGGRVALKYSAPPLIFMSGSLKQVAELK